RRPSAMWWDRAARVAARALNGAVYQPAGLATHYHTVEVHPYWAGSLDHIGIIGAHRFYRWRGAAGKVAAFTSRYLGREIFAVPHTRLAAASPEREQISDPSMQARVHEASLATAGIATGAASGVAASGPGQVAIIAAPGDDT